MVKFIINSQLPSLNDYINILKSPSGRYTGNRFKQDIDESISYQILAAGKRKIADACKEPFVILFEWHERTRKRDEDNVKSAKKYILDAMQKVGVLANDNPAHIKGQYETITYNSKEDSYVVVKIYRPDELDELKELINIDIERKR